MRKELAKIEEERKTFTGEFVRFGTKEGYKGPVGTVLLKDIRDSDGNLITDHLWFNLTVGFDSLGMISGMKVQFNARVKPYIKGYKGYNIMKQMNAPLSKDFKLSHPSKVKKLV